VLLGRILSAPDLAERLLDVLGPREDSETDSPPSQEMGWLQ